MLRHINGAEFYAYTASREPQASHDTVVFVHGAAMDHTVWALQSRYFAYHGYNILALDLPGHGQSGGDAMERIEDYGSWLNELIRNCAGGRVHLVGHSMGALICLEAAARLGDSQPALTSLSLVGFSYPMTVAPKLMDAARDQPSEAYAMMTQWSHTSATGGEPNPGFWSAGSQMSMMENSRAGVIHTDLQACNAYRAAEQAFNQVDCPVLFISGVLDKMAPCQLARQQADNQPHARIVMLKKCGHSMLSEKPDDVRDSLFEFISSQS